MSLTSIRACDRTSGASCTRRMSADAFTRSNNFLVNTTQLSGHPTNAKMLSHTTDVLRSGTAKSHAGPVHPSSKRQTHSLGRRQTPWPEQSFKLLQSGSTCTIFGCSSKSMHSRASPSAPPRTVRPTSPRRRGSTVARKPWSTLNERQRVAPGPPGRSYRSDDSPNNDNTISWRALSVGSAHATVLKRTPAALTWSKFVTSKDKFFKVLSSSVPESHGCADVILPVTFGKSKSNVRIKG
mmetsp:Transcript_30345/g.88046  ORF Transcript_30345/g.88046 Transcript_30345/m.88046 type:complete len:239 (-) Transcript_30345:1107-1823(-)